MDEGEDRVAWYPQAVVPVDHVEPVARRVRAVLGGQVVMDTTRALYLWEWPFYPQFLIPAQDVDAAALIDEQQHPPREPRHRRQGRASGRRSVSVGMPDADTSSRASRGSWDDPL